MKGEEYKIHLAIVEYLLRKYPSVEFRSDLAGIWLPKGLAKKVKKLNGGRKGWPDLFIAEPRWDYGGMFLEIKASNECVFKKNGKMRETEHIIEQHKKLETLKEKGYYTAWGLGLDSSMEQIDWYLSL